ncbi:MAG: hypothetical protein QY310_10655 [Candidatus Jettenia sp. CY-1]|nr:MAG: hypothetical protein QY310_10655 [Candidatus Jettenia sp. CY-1]
MPLERKRVETLQEIAKKLAEQLKSAMQEPSRICKETLNPGSFPEGSPQRIAQKCLWHYYKYYDDYDMIIFPILYCTEAGETDTVEIIRISPD